jgi:hypothetical protein
MVSPKLQDIERKVYKQNETVSQLERHSLERILKIHRMEIVWIFFVNRMDS